VSPNPDTVAAMRAVFHGSTVNAVEQVLRPATAAVVADRLVADAVTAELRNMLDLVDVASASAGQHVTEFAAGQRTALKSLRAVLEHKLATLALDPEGER
jgi:hypothetical protein